jgi:hypothetical protein
VLVLFTDVEEQFRGLKKSNVTSFTRNPDKRLQEARDKLGREVGHHRNID